MKMKKLMPFLFLTLMIAFVSCNKSPEKLIAKTWKVSNILSKGTYNDSIFTSIKSQLMQAEMTFKDNKYSMDSSGSTIESGTYASVDGKMVVTTEKGMKMDAVVTKESLTLDTPDFTITLQPK